MRRLDLSPPIFAADFPDRMGHAGVECGLTTRHAHAAGERGGADVVVVDQAHETFEREVFQRPRAGCACGFKAIALAPMFARQSPADLEADPIFRLPRPYP